MSKIKQLATRNPPTSRQTTGSKSLRYWSDDTPHPADPCAIRQTIFPQALAIRQTSQPGNWQLATGNPQLETRTPQPATQY